MSATDPIDQDPIAAEPLDLGPDDESALDLTDEAADELTGPVGARGAEKSASAFRTISEVAEEIGIAQHVLRFWETKFTQIRPIKRAGGRRFYRPEDIIVLREIRALLYDQGFTIKGAQKHLRSRRATVSAKRPPLPATTPAAPLPIPAAPEPHATLDPRLRDRLAMLRDDLARLHTMLRESRQAPHATPQ